MPAPYCAPATPAETAEDAGEYNTQVSAETSPVLERTLPIDDEFETVYEDLESNDSDDDYIDESYDHGDILVRNDKVRRLSSLGKRMLNTHHDLSEPQRSGTFKVHWKKPGSVPSESIKTKMQIQELLDMHITGFWELEKSLKLMISQEELFETQVDSKRISHRTRDKICDLATKYIPWDIDSVKRVLDRKNDSYLNGYLLWRLVLMLRREVEMNGNDNGESHKDPREGLDRMARVAENDFLGYRNYRVSDEEQAYKIDTSQQRRHSRSLPQQAQIEGVPQTQSGSLPSRWRDAYQAPIAPLGQFRPAGSQKQIFKGADNFHREGSLTAGRLSYRSVIDEYARSPEDRNYAIRSSDAEYLSRTPSSMAQSPVSLDRHQFSSISSRIPSKGHQTVKTANTEGPRRSSHTDNGRPRLTHLQGGREVTHSGSAPLAGERLQERFRQRAADSDYVTNRLDDDRRDTASLQCIARQSVTENTLNVVFWKWIAIFLLIVLSLLIFTFVWWYLNLRIIRGPPRVLPL